MYEKKYTYQPIKLFFQSHKTKSNIVKKEKLKIHQKYIYKENLKNIFKKKISQKSMALIDRQSHPTGES